MGVQARQDAEGRARQLEDRCRELEGVMKDVRAREADLLAAVSSEKESRSHDLRSLDQRSADTIRSVGR
jgi:hypothetical protein